MREIYRSYPHRHKGTAIVLGSGACAADDLSKVLAHRPLAAICAVNWAGGIYEPDFLVSYHYELMHKLDAHAVAAHGRGRWSRHAAIVTEAGCLPGQYPANDYWWPSMWKPAVSSTWFGITVMQAVGFSEVIVCGAPMEADSGYHPAANPPNFIGVFAKGARKTNYLRGLFAGVSRYATDLKPGVSSMSGYSREILGAPEWESE